ISIVTVVAAIPGVSVVGVFCFDDDGEGGGVGVLVGVVGDGEGLFPYGVGVVAGDGDVACVVGFSAAIGVGCGDLQSGAVVFFAFGAVGLSVSRSYVHPHQRHFLRGLESPN